MRQDLKLPLVLALICAVAAGALTWVQGRTAGVIETRLVAAKASALRAVLPAAGGFVDATDDLERLGEPFRGVRECYRGHGGEGLEGMVFLVGVPGYGGDIEVLVGVDTAGRIAALRVLAAPGETPGLGSRIGETWFQEQFAGREGILRFGSGLDGITGATVSARAVLEGANLALRAFAELWEQ